MSDCPAPKKVFDLNHPCRATCSGWKQGYERGRAEAIEECIRQLGGRYGAAATKDLRSLMRSGEDSKP